MQFRLHTLLIGILVVAVVVGLATVQMREARRQRAVVEQLRQMGARVAMRGERPVLPEFLDAQYLQRVWYVTMDGAPLESADAFAGMPNLEELYLWGTKIRDLEPLSGLARLRVLDLGPGVSDLQPLAELQQLQSLGAGGTQVQDFSPLAELRGLRSLYLYETTITDLSPLASLDQLEDLNLHHTRVSDVKPLLGLKSLRKLDITYTDVSDESLAKLRQAMPNCEIRHFRPPE